MIDRIRSFDFQFIREDHPSGEKTRGVSIAWLYHRIDITWTRA